MTRPRTFRELTSALTTAADNAEGYNRLPAQGTAIQRLQHHPSFQTAVRNITDELQGAIRNREAPNPMALDVNLALNYNSQRFAMLKNAIRRTPRRTERPVLEEILFPAPPDDDTLHEMAHEMDMIEEDV